ncbi:hypothetical protein EDF56_10288 [Novosphingobium sp. PhB165]|uniref:hypothetical protein n=1 Tax=Novosphingobium sp. PhB165 TaxID=2485105 RepID=UPI0010514486|nr:hypothetical protein [Novosphingobium sp. PhB165]TCM20427.1 hypothetical protein EDF56_10288 [Novosphingobium sp. PhB165]
MTISPIDRVSAAASGLMTASSEQAANFEPPHSADSGAQAADFPKPVAAQTIGFGNLLLPSTAMNLMKLLDGEPVAPLGSKALTDREVLQRNMKLAAANSEKPPSAGDPNYYTQKDLDTIKAATGYNLVVFNGGTAIVDDNGNPPPSDIGTNISILAATISGDRSVGIFKGEVTGGELRDIFARYADIGQSFSADWLDKAIDFLQSSPSVSQ